MDVATGPWIRPNLGLELADEPLADAGDLDQLQVNVRDRPYRTWQARTLWTDPDPKWSRPQ